MGRGFIDKSTLLFTSKPMDGITLATNKLNEVPRMLATEKGALLPSLFQEVGQCQTAHDMATAYLQGGIYTKCDVHKD
jgi:hypothetical protein